MKQVYLAHALSADTEEGIIKNKERAAEWLDWACRHYEGTHCFNMMWLLEVRALVKPEDEASGRKAGMERCFGNIRRCDELWLMGTRVSRGMTDEGTFAARCGLATFDLTTETLVPSETPRMPFDSMTPWRGGRPLFGQHPR